MIISCANKLGGGWERESTASGQALQRRRSRPRLLLLLAAAIMAARALPRQTNRCRMTNEKRHGAKIHVSLGRAEPDGYGASA